MTFNLVQSSISCNSQREIQNQDSCLHSYYYCTKIISLTRSKQTSNHTNIVQEEAKNRCGFPIYFFGDAKNKGGFVVVVEVVVLLAGGALVAGAAFAGGALAGGALLAGGNLAIVAVGLDTAAGATGDFGFAPNSPVLLAGGAGGSTGATGSGFLAPPPKRPPPKLGLLLFAGGAGGATGATGSGFLAAPPNKPPPKLGVFAGAEAAGVVTLGLTAARGLALAGTATFATGTTTLAALALAASSAAFFFNANFSSSNRLADSAATCFW